MKGFKFNMGYQNAFDSVPNSWIRKSTRLIGMNNKSFKF
jgi:hypothetical protein